MTDKVLAALHQQQLAVTLPDLTEADDETAAVAADEYQFFIKRGFFCYTGVFSKAGVLMLLEKAKEAGVTPSVILVNINHWQDFCTLAERDIEFAAYKTFYDLQVIKVVDEPFATGVV